MVAIRSLLVAALFASQGCVAGSGRMESRPFALADFDAISGSHGLHLEVTRGETFSVTVTTDDNLWDFVRVEKVGNTLELGHHPSVVYGVGTLSARVTMPALYSLQLSGASGARLKGFDQRVPRFDFIASGSSELAAASLQADELFMDLSGASGADVAGAATNARITASGASALDLYDLHTTTASVTLSGASGTSITVEQQLDYDLSGGSKLVLGGNPAVGSQVLSGGSGVSRR